MPEKQDKYAAQKKYEAENVIKVLVRLNKKTDKDILDLLNMEKPLSTQLKKLIREKQL
jgi:hypothetical protein